MAWVNSSGTLREDIPRKNLLRFGHCPKGKVGVKPKSKLFKKALEKKLHLFAAKFPVGVQKGRGGGQGDFDNVQIEADFVLG